MKIVFFVFSLGFFLSSFFLSDTKSDFKKAYFYQKEKINKNLDFNKKNYVEINLEKKEFIDDFKKREKLKKSQLQVKVETNNQEFLKKYGSRSYRNKNPGNLRYVGQIGATGKDANGYAVFESLKAGKLAHLRQIKLDASRNHTVRTFLKKYAPGQENDSLKYEQIFLKWFPNATSKTLLKNLNLEKVQKIMQQIEGYIVPEK
jgi:hypothetical protein